MLKVQSLVKPSKKSGLRLEPNQSTKMRGVMITNMTSKAVYVDKWTRPSALAKNKKKRK